MKGLLHFNTSLVTPPPLALVNYSHPDLKDFSPLPPFIFPPVTINSLGLTYSTHIQWKTPSILLERGIRERSCLQAAPS